MAYLNTMVKYTLRGQLSFKGGLPFKGGCEKQFPFKGATITMADNKIPKKFTDAMNSAFGSPRPKPSLSKELVKAWDKVSNTFSGNSTDNIAKDFFEKQSPPPPRKK